MEKTGTKLNGSAATYVVFSGAQAQELVDVLNEFGVTECYYGHLHGKSIRYATQGERDGITYRLISADGLSFCPYKIR